MTGTALEQVDSEGALSPVTLDFKAANLSYTGTGDADADHALFQGYIHNNNAGNIPISLKNVPLGSYNLYVYGVGFNSHRDQCTLRSDFLRPPASRFRGTPMPSD